MSESKMSDLENAVKYLCQAQDSEDRKNYAEAIEQYSTALAYFASAAINNQITILPLKEEVKRKINLCLSSIKNMCQRINDNGNDMGESTGHDSKAVQRVESTLLSKKPNVNFDDVCGMEDLKNDLKISLILPVVHSELFVDGRDPYKAFLFFGPPGTGKSYLAQAVAGETKCSKFYSISASDVLSRYVGESEHFIKQLFENARKKTPSIIFIDEIDALACKRTDSDDGKGRGMKAELFAQMEGLSGNNDGIFIMAATNTPYDLDDALLRRFDKLVYISLPDENDRLNMFKKKLIDKEKKLFSEENFRKLAAATKGFSASDIHKLCRKINLMPLNRLFACTYFQVTDKDSSQDEVYTPCEADAIGAKKVNLIEIPKGCLAYTPVTTLEDALHCVNIATPSKASNISEIEKFVKERCDSVYPTPSRIDDEVTWKTIINDVTSIIFG